MPREGKIMAKKEKRFADDGWAVWVEGDDTSTVFIDDWINPKGKSYVDLAIGITGALISTALYVYVPFEVKREEIEDVSLNFNNRSILQATFSSGCIVDYMKNPHTSEIAYNGKTVDVVHISTLDIKTEKLDEGTLISLDINSLRPYLDNDEMYLIWRMPHRSLDEIFKASTNASGLLRRLSDLITSPVVTKKYGYSIRINEARLLPEEITCIGAFHRQKLKRAVVTLSVNENYELNDGGCYRIRRLEEKLYKGYLPKDYDTDGVITYQWNQSRENNLLGHFNFYYNMSTSYVSRASMIIYLILLLGIGPLGDGIIAGIRYLIGLIG